MGKCMKQLLFLTVGGYISTGSTPLICLLKEYEGVEVLNTELRVGESGLYTLIGRLMNGEQIDKKQFDLVKNTALNYGDSLNYFLSLFLSLIIRLPGCPKTIAGKISQYRLKFRGYDKKVVGYNKVIKKLFKELSKINNSLGTITDEERFSRLSMMLNESIEKVKVKNISNVENLLVIDQLISPKVLFSDQYSPSIVKLLPDAKIIIVKRDPRDQYIDFIKKHKKEYHLMSHNDSLNHYIAEFKERYDKMNFLIADYHAENVLFLWFEDLINNYEEENKKLANFLGLKKHEFKFKYFYPGVAESYVGMYLTYKHQKDIAKIATEMKEHLYQSTK